MSKVFPHYAMLWAWKFISLLSQFHRPGIREAFSSLSGQRTKPQPLSTLGRISLCYDVFSCITHSGSTPCQKPGLKWVSVKLGCRGDWRGRGLIVLHVTNLRGWGNCRPYSRPLLLEVLSLLKLPPSWFLTHHHLQPSQILTNNPKLWFLFPIPRKGCLWSFFCGSAIIDVCFACSQLYPNT